MKKKSIICWLLAGAAVAFLMLPSLAAEEVNVVVLPIGGTVGNATSADVVKDKTFSSRKAGRGVKGTLKIRNGSTIFTNSIGMEFSLIPSGSFVMGSPDGTGDSAHRPVWPVEISRDSDELQHVVSLSKAFYMQTTEVTQGQWQQMMGNNPANFTACGLDCPVEDVSWNDAQNFIDALNASENRTNCNTSPNTCYSLPSESQWEYAARAGTVTAFYNGGITNISCSPLDPNLDLIGWYCGNAGSTTHPVAQKKPNNWGLFDMSGNVWEWCDDWYGTYPDGPETDPPGAGSGSFRVIRGGGWSSFAGLARSAERNGNAPGDRGSNLGFRLVLPVQVSR